MHGEHVHKAELAHNLAIAFWICANGYWMISEFFGFAETQLTGSFTGKHMALVPFLIGAVILCIITMQRPEEIREAKTVTMGIGFVFRVLQGRCADKAKRSGW